MCGIAAAPTFEKAFNLYRLNLHRGSYSSGLMSVDTKTGAYFIYKQQKAFEEIESLLWKIEQSRNNFDYFLFHSRAPTNSTETLWTAETTHPFAYDNCHVAHNGIITNFQELNKDLNFNVDTQIIPYNLIKTYNIQETYSNLQGLLTSWIVWGKDVHVIKAGSSLWMDKDSFSSSKFEGAHYIEEDGVIFNYINNKFEKSGTFPYTSTYFI
jgi:glucosamine 6-phosphate synthetase-like amidotransferase/phosphosugar isomerase protein